MNAELKHFLTEGPRSAQDLARLTGKSVSTIYKAIKDADEVKSRPNPSGSGNVYWLQPLEDGPEAIETAPSTNPTAQSHAIVPDQVKSPTNGKRGRKPGFAGCRLTAICSENPRRKNSHGFKSLQIIIDRPDISYDDYLAAGGRLVDLRWDINNGNVKAA